MEEKNSFLKKFSTAYNYTMKAIYLTDLALKYFPQSTKRSAVTQLRRWISLNPALRKRLDELSFHKGQRILTPLQHEAIVYHLGEPGEE